MTTLAAVAANFTRDLEDNYRVIADHVERARAAGVDFLVFPEAAIGGYLSSLGNHGDTVATTSRSLPPAISLDGPEIKRVQAIAGDMLIAIGFCELAEDGVTRYNAAAVLDGERIYGSYRKVHQPLGENMSYSAGTGYGVFDTPVGRVGLQICYDKAFPEAARIMALQGAEIIASLSAWPAARTATAENLQEDRWTYRFNLFDTARALDNQVFWIAANQSGTFGSLRYVGNARSSIPVATYWIPPSSQRDGRRRGRHRRHLHRHARRHVPSARPTARCLRAHHRHRGSRVAGTRSCLR